MKTETPLVAAQRMYNQCLKSSSRSELTFWNSRIEYTHNRYSNTYNGENRVTLYVDVPESSNHSCVEAFAYFESVEDALICKKALKSKLKTSGIVKFSYFMAIFGFAVYLLRVNGII